MSMFCYQCQEAASGIGCKIRGVCGKPDNTAQLQDLLIYVVKGIACCVERAEAAGQKLDQATARFVSTAIFTTITNANFDDKAILDRIREGLTIRDAWRAKGASGACACASGCGSELPDCVLWTPKTEADIMSKAAVVGVLSTEDADIRSLRELITYGLKGVAAYAQHAAELGYEDLSIDRAIVEALTATIKDLPVSALVSMTLKVGETAVKTMALLDKANTTAYGKPKITTVQLGVRTNPGIIISGHDLRDMEDLMEQTRGTGVDVYTHSEMLPAHYYPKFQQYDNLAGNYGGSWWHQNEDFESFNGPILMTTNCIIPVKGSYLGRMFTTGAAGYPGAAHIADRPAGGRKDFSKIIALAKTCAAPRQIETGTLVGGFAHDQVLALADKVVAAVKSGAIKRFVVMAGCDGRMKERQYFTDVANALPKDAVILTAGCAKYRYNKLPLGDIGGIPRVLDAGQCNDSFSLAVIALRLKEVFGLEDINQLPVSYDIAWYEQKAVAVLLALLSIGVKHIRLGPTLPAFLSPNVAKVLVENFDIKPTGQVAEDVAAIMAGR